MEAVVEVDQSIAIADRGVDVLFDRRPGSDADLRGLDSPGPEPPGEQIEEVDSVLDKDAATLAAVPKPVFGWQVFIGSVVLKRPVKHFTKDPVLDQPTNGVEKRVVPLHEVGDEQVAPPSGDGDQLIGLVDGQG